MKINLAVLFMLVGVSCFAQDLTVYKSPYDYETTVLKVKESIETLDVEIQNEFKFKLSTCITFNHDTYASALTSCQPTTALEFPLKIVIWQEYEEVFIGYSDPRYMTRKYLLDDCEEILDLINRLMLRIANMSIRKT